MKCEIDAGNPDQDRTDHRDGWRDHEKLVDGKKKKREKTERDALQKGPMQPLQSLKLPSFIRGDHLLRTVKKHVRLNIQQDYSQCRSRHARSYVKQPCQVPTNSLSEKAPWLNGSAIYFRNQAGV